MAPPKYTKHFIPLESDPLIFTQLIHALGASPALRFKDVLSLDEPSLFPNPALALILTFPTTADYEERRATEAASQKPQAGGHEDGDVLWFKQTINNACGLYAILHAAANGEGTRYIQPNSTLSKLLEECASLSSDERARYLEGSIEIEAAYRNAAEQGESEVSENPEDEVNFHYVCFTKDVKGKVIWELDGDKMGPVKRGEDMGSGEDMLGDTGRRVIRERMREEGGGENVAFSLMALMVELEG
ncbi:hypothetical protein DPSP01_008091 [Paraphaeosphaeria sporulosa]